MSTPYEDQAKLWNELLPTSTGLNTGANEKLEAILQGVQSGRLDPNFDFNANNTTDHLMLTPLSIAIANGGSKDLINALLDKHKLTHRPEFSEAQKIFVSHSGDKEAEKVRRREQIAQREALVWANVLMDPFHQARERYNKNKDPESLEILKLMEDKLQLFKDADLDDYDAFRIQTLENIGKKAKHYFRVQTQIQEYQREKEEETRRLTEEKPTEIQLEIEREREESIIQNIDQEELASSQIDERLANDRESSMLSPAEMILTQEAVKRMIKHYENALLEKGGTDKVIEEIQQYLVEKIGDPEALTNIDKRSGVNRETDRYKLALRSLLDDPKAMGSYWDGLFHQPELESEEVAKFTFFSGETINYKKLLAYYWLAASDKNMPTIKEENASADQVVAEERENLIRQISEIRRAHNGPGESFSDDSTIDNPSCPAGVFGRLSFSPLRNIISRRESSIMGNAKSDLTEFFLSQFPKKNSLEWTDLCEVLHFIRNQNFQREDAEFSDNPDMLNLQFSIFSEWILKLHAMKNDFLNFLEKRYGTLDNNTKQALFAMYDRTVQDLDVLNPVMVPNPNPMNPGDLYIRPPLCAKLVNTFLDYAKEQQIEKQEQAIIAKLEAKFKADYSPLIMALNELSKILKTLELQKKDISPAEFVNKIRDINQQYKSLEKKKQQIISTLLLTARNEKQESLSQFINIEEQPETLLNRLNKFDIIGSSKLIQALKTEYDNALITYESNESGVLNHLTSQRKTALAKVFSEFEASTPIHKQMEELQKKLNEELAWIQSAESLDVSKEEMLIRQDTIETIKKQIKQQVNKVFEALEAVCEKEIGFLSSKEISILQDYIDASYPKEKMEKTISAIVTAIPKRNENKEDIKASMTEILENIGDFDEDMEEEIKRINKSLKRVTEAFEKDLNEDNCYSVEDDEYFQHHAKVKYAVESYYQLKDSVAAAIASAKRYKKKWTPEDLQAYEDLLTKSLNKTCPPDVMQNLISKFDTLNTTVEKIQQKRKNVKDEILNFPKEVSDNLQAINKIQEDAIKQLNNGHYLSTDAIKQLIQSQKEYTKFEQDLFLKCKQANPPLNNLSENVIRRFLHTQYTIDKDFSKIFDTRVFSPSVRNYIHDYATKLRNDADHLKNEITHIQPLDLQYQDLSNLYIADENLVLEQERALNAFVQNLADYAKRAKSFDDRALAFQIFETKSKEQLNISAEDTTLIDLLQQNFEAHYPRFLFTGLYRESQFHLDRLQDSCDKAKSLITIRKTFTKVVNTQQNAFQELYDKCMQGIEGKDLTTLEAEKKQLLKILNNFKLEVHNDFRAQIASAHIENMNPEAIVRRTHLEKALQPLQEKYNALEAILNTKKKEKEALLEIEKKNKIMEETTREYIATLNIEDKAFLSTIEAEGKLFKPPGKAYDIEDKCKTMNQTAVLLRDPERALTDFKQHIFNKYNEMPPQHLIDKFNTALKETFAKNSLETIQNNIEKLKVQYKTYLKDLEKELWKDYGSELKDEMSKFAQTISNEITTLSKKKDNTSLKQKDILIDAKDEFDILQQRTLDHPDTIRRTANDLDKFASDLRNDIDATEAQTQGTGFTGLVSRIKQACTDLINCIWGSTRNRIIKLQETTKDTTRTFFHFDAKKVKEALSQTRSYSVPPKESQADAEPKPDAAKPMKK